VVTPPVDEDNRQGALINQSDDTTVSKGENQT